MEMEPEPRVLITGGAGAVFSKNQRLHHSCPEGWRTRRPPPSWVMVGTKSVLHI